MHKLGQVLLAGTILSGVASVAAVEFAKAAPLAGPMMLAAATCPQGQVGTPPNCKPAPPPQKPQTPPPQHTQPVQPQQHTPPVQPQQHTQPVQPQQHTQPVQPQQHTQPVQPQQHTQPVQPQQHTQPVQPQQHTQPVQPQQHTVPNQTTPPALTRQNPNQTQPGPTTTHLHPPQAPALPALTTTQATPLQKHNGPASLTTTNSQGQPINNVAGLRSERHESVVNGQTVITEGHRVIVRDPNGAMVIRHDDVDRFRYGARDVKIERHGNDNVTTVVLGNGSRVVTTLGPDGRILRRSRFDPSGREIVLIAAAATVGALFVERPPPVLRIPRDRYIVDLESAPPDYVYGAFSAPPVEEIDQAYSLDQVLDSPSLRDLMPSVDIDTITFETGSWEVAPDAVDRLQVIADSINRVISANPKEVFLVEGHTDAVGNDVDNMSLSDRRAETVALILSDKFAVPPENLVTQGYGSQFLRIPTPGAERRNRRVTIRRITPLLAGR